LNSKLSFIRQHNSRYVDDSQSALATVIKLCPPLEAAINELLEKGLIRKDNRVIVVHHVVQEAMNYYNIEDLQDSFDAAVQLVSYFSPRSLFSRDLNITAD